MKHIALTAALAAVALLGFNAQSNALSPQGVSAQMRTQSMLLGATESVNITLHDGQGSYVVPTGKVLHIEHFIWALESATHQWVRIAPANQVPGVGDVTLKFGLGDDEIYSPTRPIRVVGDGNAGVSVLNNGAADWKDVVIVGYLTNA
jgi:hypothetical protein